MDLQDKRREKDGGYDRKETLELFADMLDEVKEFAIVFEDKDGMIGGLCSTRDGVKVVGMLEHAKTQWIISNN